MENSLASPLAEAYDLEVHTTFRSGAERSRLQRVAFGLGLFFRSLGRIVRGRVAIADIHAVSDRDFLKHVAVVLAARLAGTRCILRIHGGDFDRVYARGGRASRLLTRLALRLPDHVVLLSESWERVIQEIQPRAQTAVVPNAVRTDIYRAYADGRPEGSQRVFLLGNLCERKGHFDALEAAAAIHEDYDDFELCFAGAERDPGAEAALRQRAAQLGLETVVRFLGPVFGKEKEELFTSSGVFILPSHTENMPLSIMEAMAAGLPVVATRVGAVCEMISDDRNGMLIEPRDPTALASALRELFDDSEKRTRLAEQAARHAHASWDNASIAERNAALYQAASPHA